MYMNNLTMNQSLRKLHNMKDFACEVVEEFQVDLNRVVCSDARLFAPSLPDNSVDLIFTSPPYNLGMDYDVYDDKKGWYEYQQWLLPLLDSFWRVLKTGGRMVINVSPAWSEYFPTHAIITEYLIGAGWSWKAEILWDKNNYNCAYTTWGSWMSASAPYFKYTHEFVLVFCKDDRKRDGKGRVNDITREEFMKWTTAKWSIAGGNKKQENDHPATFPPELARRVIKLFSFQEDVVFDPFCGIGTTCVVAKEHNRFYLGCDISPDYVKQAQIALDKVLTSVV